MDPCYLIQLSRILQGFSFVVICKALGTLHDSISKVFVGLWKMLGSFSYSLPGSSIVAFRSAFSLSPAPPAASRTTESSEGALPLFFAPAASPTVRSIALCTFLRYCRSFSQRHRPLFDPSRCILSNLPVVPISILG